MGWSNIPTLICSGKTCSYFTLILISIVVTFVLHNLQLAYKMIQIPLGLKQNVIETPKISAFKECIQIHKNTVDCICEIHFFCLGVILVTFWRASLEKNVAWLDAYNAMESSCGTSSTLQLQSVTDKGIDQEFSLLWAVVHSYFFNFAWVH